MEKQTPAFGRRETYSVLFSPLQLSEWCVTMTVKRG